MPIVFVVIAFLVGGLLPFQAAANRRFGEAAGSGWYAAMWNFVVGGIALAIVLIALRSTGRVKNPHVEALPAIPIWAWFGGLCGAALVFTTLSLVGRIGAIAMLGAIAAGQIIASTLVDSFGLFEVKQRELSAGRIVGVLLLLAGIIVFTISSRAASAGE